MQEMGSNMLSHIALTDIMDDLRKYSASFGEVWDEYGTKVTEKISSVAHLIYDEITSAWNKGSQWVLDLYGLTH